MAVTKDGSVVIATATSAPGNAFNGPSFTVSTNSNKLAIFKVAVAEAGAPTISGISWNSQSATQLATILGGAGNVRTEIWYIKNPTAGTATPVVSTSGSIQAAACSAQSLYSVDQSTPFGTARTNSGTSGTIAAIGVDGVTDGLIIGCVASGDATSSATARNGIPYWVASGTQTAVATQTSHTNTNAPAGRLRGDIEVVTFDTETAAAHTLSGSGWTRIGTQATYVTSRSRSVAYRIYDGSNVDPAISWSGSADVWSRRHIWRDSKVSSGAMAEIGTLGTGTTTTHTSTGANTTANDVLAVYLDSCNANTAAAAPAGWTERFDAGSATGPSRTVGGDKEIATSGTATGNISITAGATAWIQQQYQLFQSDAGDQTTEATANNIASLISFGDASETAQTFNTLAWTLAGTVDEWMTLGVCVNPVVSGDVTVALTGTAGTGQTGTLVPNLALALTGVSATGQTGTLIEGDAEALTGVSATGQTGTLTPNITIALTGVSATGQTGTLSPAGDLTLALTGVSATGATGTLTPAINLALTGVTGTGATGTLGPQTAIALTGVTATSATGTLSAQAGGDITVALIGVQAIGQTGFLTPSGGDLPVTGDTHDGGRKRKRFDDSAGTQVIRESQLKPKQRKEKKSATVVATPESVSFDAQAEDEELLLLQLDEDERLNTILALAESVLKSLR